MIATEDFNPADSESRVGLQSRIADVLADVLGARAFGERVLEIAAQDVVEREIEMRHPQPPALIRQMLQQRGRTRAVRDPLRRRTGPMTLEREHAVRLSERRIVAG